MHARDAWRVVKQAAKDFKEDKVPRLAAALAYYGVFALVPLAISLVVLAGMLVGEGAARREVIDAVSTTAGPSVAEGVANVLENVDRPGAGRFGALGVVVFLFVAAGAFVQLQDALDTVWEVRPEKRKGLRVLLQVAKKRLLGVLVALLVAALVVASLVASALLAGLRDVAGGMLPGGAAPWQVAEFVVSLAVLAVGFAVVFKVLPDVRIAWKDVAFGAAVTAALFAVGKSLVAWYVGRSDVISAFGAAAFVLVLLFWFFYSAAVLLFGAELTQAWARVRGRPVEPDEGAVWTSDEARARHAGAERARA